MQECYNQLFFPWVEEKIHYHKNTDDCEEEYLLIFSSHHRSTEQYLEKKFKKNIPHFNWRNRLKFGMILVQIELEAPIWKCIDSFSVCISGKSINFSSLLRCILPKNRWQFCFLKSLLQAEKAFLQARKDHTLKLSNAPSTEFVQLLLNKFRLWPLEAALVRASNIYHAICETSNPRHISKFGVRYKKTISNL